MKQTVYRCTDLCSRIVLITFFLTVLISAIVSMSFSYFLPRADHYRGEMLNWLNNQYPATNISADRLSGHWEAFRPTLYLENVRLKNKSWASDLTFSSLTVQFDVLKSLRYEKPYFSHVELSDLNFSLTQSEQGRWALSTANTTQASTADIKEVILSLWGIDNLKVNDLRLSLKPYEKEAVQLPPLAVQGVTTNQQRKVVVSLKDQDQTLQVLTATAEGEPFSDHFQTKGYLHLKQYNNFDFLCLLHKDSALKEAGFSANLWFDYKDQVLSATTDLSLTKVKLAPLHNPDIEPFVIDKVETRATILATPERFQLWMPELTIDAAGDSISVREFQLDKKAQLTLGLKSLNLSDVVKASRWPMLPDKLSEVLLDLSPSGSLDNLLVRFDNDQFTLRADANHLSVDAWKGVPALAGVTGQLRLSKAGGAIHFQSQPLTAHFTQVYSKPQTFDQAQGVVSWSITDDWVTVIGKALAVEGQFGKASGEFHLQLPVSEKTKHSEPPRLVLAIDGENIPSNYQSMLIPDKKLPVDVLNWIDDSVLDGQVSKGSFILHGPLADVEGTNAVPEKLAIQLWLDVAGAKINYFDQLPPATSIRGEVLINDRLVDAVAQSADVAGISVHDATVTLLEKKDTLALQVKGQVRGKAEPLHAYLQQPFINEQAKQLFDNMALSKGQFNGSLELALDLNQPDDIDLGVSGQLKGLTLSFPEENLAVKAIQGDLSYKLSSGLSSRKLTGTFWGEKLDAKINTHLNQTAITFNTDVSVDALHAWQPLPEMSFFKGKTGVRGQITFDSSKAELTLNSQLEGIASTLPEPFFKAVNDQARFYLHFPLSDDKPILSINYGQHTHLGFLFEEKQLLASEINFDAKPLGFEPNTLRLSGKLDVVKIEDWVDALSQFEKASKALGLPETSHFQEKIDQLEIKECWLEDYRVNDLTLYGQSYADFWHLNFEQAHLEGGIDIYRDDNKPLSLFIKTIDLDAILDQAKPSDGTEQVNLDSFPHLEVAINQLLFQGKDLGFWQFKSFADSDKGQLVVTDIHAKRQQMSILPISAKEPTQVVWDTKQNTTTVKGKIEGKNFSDLLALLDFGKEITSKAYEVTGDVTWPGKPKDFEFARTKGDVRFSMKQGNFTAIETSSTQAIKVIGILNINYLLKRLKLDFSDLTKKGFAFDKLKGEVTLHNGKLRTKEPVQVKSPSSDIQIAGSADTKDQSLNVEMAVSLPLATNIPWIATLAATGAVGLWPAAGVFLVSQMFKSQVNKLSTFVYQIKGSFDEPKIRFKKLFEPEKKPR